MESPIFEGFSSYFDTTDLIRSNPGATLLAEELTVFFKSPLYYGFLLPG